MSMPAPEQPERPKVCRILSLDGGGAKGFYTLGVLREVEALTGKRLWESFDIIFGTSTGSIIASLLALGENVETIHKLYCENVPEVMSKKSASAKSAALAALADEVFGKKTFEDVKTGLGVVTTKWDLETPMIFKGSVAQAHGRVGTFKPGFGCTIGDAVQASCSAYPYFNRKIVTTAMGDKIELVDGGYCANNPTLYGIADAVAAMKYKPEDCRVLSIGCGNYPSPTEVWYKRTYRRVLPTLSILEKTMGINVASMEQLRQILFKSVPTVRVNDTFERPEMATDLFEHNMDKLNILRQRGAESYAIREAEIKGLLMSEEV
ncbi:patatin-like phospholipase family protein [Pseudotabrizicola sp.]|uniref:patatin-like phospholipase family protein n=1 Tax=Pseudotabrizicola sp. TaxID=2939647 RepID=UPI0027283C5A|nr:patatin-like phospholipase family protein [Pseudotabrizicola sp.]MDO8883296.1 patatin-like phospholipase family protein [Pseudotabrizicola sp.]